MNQDDYIQAVEEMKIPASKALEWASVIAEKYYHHYSETNRKNHDQARERFDSVAEASQRLVDMIPQIQEQLRSDQTDWVTLEIFVHILAGPIMTMGAGIKIILMLPFWHPEKEQTEDEKEHIRYVKKIDSAVDYLSSLDRDVILKRMLDGLDG